MGSRLALVSVFFLVCLGLGCEVERVEPAAAYDPSADTLRYAGEVHLRNVRQLTFGGNNAEAYWSFDDEQLIFQSDWGRDQPAGLRPAVRDERRRERAR